MPLSTRTFLASARWLMPSSVARASIALMSKKCWSGWFALGACSTDTTSSPILTPHHTLIAF